MAFLSHPAVQHGHGAGQKRLGPGLALFRTGQRQPIAQKIFTAIEAEWHRTAEALAQITGEKNRLANNPALARSIRHRFPYIDPLHHLQVELVRRYRAGLADERVQRGIHISINGIAAGLRNTG